METQQQVMLGISGKMSDFPERKRSNRRAPGYDMLPLPSALDVNVITGTAVSILNLEIRTMGRRIESQCAKDGGTERNEEHETLITGDGLYQPETSISRPPTEEDD